MYITAHRLPVQILAMTLVGAPIFFAVALSQVPADPDAGIFTMPPVWLPAAYVAYAVAAHLLADAALYRTTPIPAGTARPQAAALAVAQYKAAMMRRVFLIDILVPASVGAVFVVPTGGYVALLIAALLTAALMALHVYPNRRTVERTETALNRDGGASHLSELLGYAPWTGSEEDKALSTADPLKR